MMANQTIIAPEWEISLFEPISLSEMDHVKLMNRVDSKFLIPLDRLPEIMQTLRQDYKVLEIDGHRSCDYKTVYFDTKELSLYNDHRKGRANRYKIRQRYYVHSNLTFTEIKFKNNKGRTNKSRIRKEGEPGALDEKSIAFIRESSPYDPFKLQPLLWVNYTRITLVNKFKPERLTLDLKLTFHNAQHKKDYPRLVIAEVKQDTRSSSPFTQLIKKYNLREGGISKYCLGIIDIYPDVACNNFKPNLYHIQKTLKNASITTTCHT